MGAGARAEAFLARLTARDRQGAQEFVDLLLRQGVPAGDVITGVLAPAQREVGRRWASNEWTVAEEHAATAITDMVLSALVARGHPRPFRPPIMVTCAEGDWHALAPKMFAELMRLDGWPVTFLGASTPAADLRRFLADEPPFAFAVGCSVPMFLPGAKRTIAAARDADVPVLAGGAGFGPDASRATAIGAHGWAADAAEASALLARWQRDGAPPSPTPRDDAVALQLAGLQQQIIEVCLDRLADQYPPMRAFDQRQFQHTASDFGYILQFLQAALLTGDARIIDELTATLETILPARGLPRSVVRISLDVVAESLPGEFRTGGDWLRAATLPDRRPRWHRSGGNEPAAGEQQ